MSRSPVLLYLSCNKPRDLILSTMSRSPVLLYWSGNKPRKRILSTMSRSLVFVYLLGNKPCHLMLSTMSRFLPVLLYLSGNNPRDLFFFNYVKTACSIVLVVVAHIVDEDNHSHNKQPSYVSSVQLSCKMY